MHDYFIYDVADRKFHMSLYYVQKSIRLSQTGFLFDYANKFFGCSNNNSPLTKLKNPQIDITIGLVKNSSRPKNLFANIQTRIVFDSTCVSRCKKWHYVCEMSLMHIRSVYTITFTTLSTPFLWFSRPTLHCFARLRLRRKVRSTPASLISQQSHVTEKVEGKLAMSTVRRANEREHTKKFHPNYIPSISHSAKKSRKLRDG